MAVDDAILNKNPFGFELAGVVVTDSVTREAITKEQMRKFLKFVHDDNVYCKYYKAFYILFHTGMRIIRRMTADHAAVSLASCTRDIHERDCNLGIYSSSDSKHKHASRQPSDCRETGRSEKRTGEANRRGEKRAGKEVLSAAAI